MNIKRLITTVLVFLILMLIAGALWYNKNQNIPSISLINDAKITEVKKIDGNYKIGCSHTNVQSTRLFVRELQKKYSKDWKRIQLFVNIVPLYVLEINNSEIVIHINKDGIMIINHGENQIFPVEKILQPEEMNNLVAILCPAY